MERYRIVEGQTLSGKKQLLLGRLAAKNFNKTVGQTFKINEVSYRVVGIYETGVAMEDGGAVMPARRRAERLRQERPGQLFQRQRQGPAAPRRDQEGDRVSRGESGC